MRPVENLRLPGFKNYLEIGTRVAIKPGSFTPVAVEATVVAHDRNMMGTPLYDVEIKKRGGTNGFYASELEHDPSKVDLLLNQAAEF